MSVKLKVLYFSLVPSLIFGAIIFLIGWFGGVSLTKSVADFPSLGISNLPFTNLVVNSTKTFSILYLAIGILYALYSIYQSQKSPNTKRKFDLVSVFIIIMIGGLAVSSSAFIALLILAR